MSDRAAAAVTDQRHRRAVRLVDGRHDRGDVVGEAYAGALLVDRRKAGQRQRAHPVPRGLERGHDVVPRGGVQPEPRDDDDVHDDGLRTRPRAGRRRLAVASRRGRTSQTHRSLSAPFTSASQTAGIFSLDGPYAVGTVGHLGTTSEDVMHSKAAGALALFGFALLAVVAGRVVHTAALALNPHGLTLGSFAAQDGHGYSSGFYLVVLLVLTGAAALSMTAYRLSHSHREEARVKARSTEDGRGRRD